MNFKDTVVYLILAIFILAIAISFFLLATKNPSYGDKVSVPKAKGFRNVDPINWNAYSIGKNTTIELEVKSSDELPLRIQLLDEDGNSAIKIMRNREECKVIETDIYIKDKKVQKNFFSPFISGSDSMKLIISVTGNTCNGITGQGYVYLINFPVEMHDKVYLIEEGIISGFFS
ncbi:MAG: hypothetical protein QXF76_03705 [Candidatus Anstonellales archaeon]